jgi:hypothetical protein
LRKWQTSHSFQGDIKECNVNVWNKFVERSDFEVQRCTDQNFRHRKNQNADSLPIPPEVLELCKDPENVDPLARIDLVADNDEDLDFDLE